MMYWCVDFGNSDYPGGVWCYEDEQKARADYEAALHQWKLGIRVDCPEFLGFRSLEEV